MKEDMTLSKSLPNPKDRRSTITLGIVGDIMIMNRAYDFLQKVGVPSLAKKIWAPLEGTDIILANLEAPLTNLEHPREDKRYNLKMNLKVVDLFDCRFIFSLANNHMFDFGEQGFLDTIDTLKAKNILFAGAGRNIEEAKRPAIKTICGIKLGVISAADERFQAATNFSPGTFPARHELIEENIKEIRKQVEIVIVSFHVGSEFVPTPTPNQIRLAELCLEGGASVVVFHHAHCISGGINNERGAILYGTGNYIFPHVYPIKFKPWAESAVWRIKLALPGPSIERVEIQPILLDDNGIPSTAPDKKSIEILRKIRLYSHFIQQNKLNWWRLREMIRPIYLRLNIFNFASIYHHQGVKSMLRTFYKAAKSLLR